MLCQIFTQGENEVLIASKARWDEQLQGLIELERRFLTLRQEVEHLSERQEVLADLMVSMKDMQKVAPEDFQKQIFQKFKKAGGAEDKGSAGTRTKEAQSDQVGRRKGKGKDHAKVGCVKSNRSMVWRPRLFFLWFLLVVPGPPHRRSNVCFLQDGARNG